mgnify:CR=1 FL=1
MSFSRTSSTAPLQVLSDQLRLLLRLRERRDERANSYAGEHAEHPGHSEQEQAAADRHSKHRPGHGERDHDVGSQEDQQRRHLRDDDLGRRGRGHQELLDRPRLFLDHE